MRLGPRQRSRQGATVKYEVRRDGVYIAPEDEEERQVVEITIKTLLG